MKRRVIKWIGLDSYSTTCSYCRMNLLMLQLPISLVTAGSPAVPLRLAVPPRYLTHTSSPSWPACRRRAAGRARPALRPPPCCTPCTACQPPPTAQPCRPPHAAWQTCGERQAQAWERVCVRVCGVCGWGGGGMGCTAAGRGAGWTAGGDTGGAGRVGARLGKRQQRRCRTCAHEVPSHQNSRLLAPHNQQPKHPPAPFALTSCRGWRCRPYHRSPPPPGQHR